MKSNDDYKMFDYEIALATAIAEAKARGLVAIKGHFYSHNSKGLPGVCANGALRLNANYMHATYTAMQDGNDGIPLTNNSYAAYGPYADKWYTVGAAFWEAMKS